MKNKFENAKEMQKKFPKTFKAPTKKELAELKVKDIVKVCCANERFWSIITKIQGNKIIAKVDNDLVFSDEHGLICGDTIKFFKENIYDIFK